jgi:hypothetical protein
MKKTAYIIALWLTLCSLALAQTDTSFYRPFPTGKADWEVARVMYDNVQTLLVNDLTLSGMESGAVIYFAHSIKVSPGLGSSYVVQPGAKVELLATGSIEFNPGFESEVGANLEAQIIDPNSLANIGMAGIADANASGIHAMNNQHPYILSEGLIYPSPFTESFSLSFTIAADARVTVELCNALGQTIRTCCDNTSYEAGSHTLNIDGRGLAGGTYFAKILIDGAVVKTVPLMKVEQ